MDPWKTFKDRFDAWEKTTSKVAEALLKSPVVLQPAGATLTAWARAKRFTDDMRAQWWSRNGLPTRREQERMLHTLNQLHSRLYDLEEQLEDMQDALTKAVADRPEATKKKSAKPKAKSS